MIIWCKVMICLLTVVAAYPEDGKCHLCSHTMSASSLDTYTVLLTPACTTSKLTLVLICTLQLRSCHHSDRTFLQTWWNQNVRHRHASSRPLRHRFQKAVCGGGIDLQYTGRGHGQRHLRSSRCAKYIPTIGQVRIFVHDSNSCAGPDILRQVAIHLPMLKDLVHLATVSSAFHAALKTDPRLTEDCSIMKTVYQADVGATISLKSHRRVLRMCRSGGDSYQVREDGRERGEVYDVTRRDCLRMIEHVLAGYSGHCSGLSPPMQLHIFKISCGMGGFPAWGWGV